MSTASPRWLVPLSPASCTSTGGGDGIHQSSPYGNLTVTNGTVRGMGSDGIITIEGPGARIQGVRAIGNGSTGIQTWDNSTVEDNTVLHRGSGATRSPATAVSESSTTAAG